MIPKPEIPKDDDEYEPIDGDLEAPPLKRIPKKLKYKDKGFQIQRSKTGQEWTLVSYYRSAADMRKSYAATTGPGRDYWDNYHYRMVFPDGSIVPR